MPPANQPGVALDLKRNIQAGTRTTVVDDPKKAEAVLEFTQESRDKLILSLAATGRVREFQLRYRVSFRVHDGKGGEFLPASTVQLTRDVTFNDTRRAGEGNGGPAALPRHAVRHGAADHAPPRRGAATQARGAVGARAAARRAGRQPPFEEFRAGLPDPRRRAAAGARGRRRGARRGAQAGAQRARSAVRREGLRLGRVRAIGREPVAVRRPQDRRAAPRLGQARRGGRAGHRNLLRQAESGHGPAHHHAAARGPGWWKAGWFTRRRCGGRDRRGAAGDRARSCRSGSRSASRASKQRASAETLEFIADRVEGNLLAAQPGSPQARAALARGRTVGRGSRRRRVERRAL